jgi:cytochrome c biogenesis protein
MQSVKPPERAVSQPSDEEPTAAPPAQAVYSEGPDLFDAVWRFFCSTRLALVLILVIAAASLAGTLLVQAPPGITADAVEYARWLNTVRPKYGPWTDLLSALQLLNVFNSIWFRLLLAALAMNTIVCTVNRWNGIWRSISKPRVRMGDGFFRKASHSVVLSANGTGVQTTADAVGESLTAQRYRVLAEHDDGRVYLYADKNRYGKLGTFLNHLSLVLILVGAIAGSFLGFRERGFVVPVGYERPLGYGTQLTIRVDEFIDEYYPEGPPKDYRSEAVLFDNGVEVKRHTIRVNDPLEYNGVRFYQSFFGPAVALEIRDADGNLIYNDGLGLAWRTKEERPVGSFTLPEQGLEVYVVMPFSGRADPLIPAGQVRVEVYQAGTRVPESIDNLVTGRPKKVGDLEYHFVRELQFTGLQVAKDPGTPIIWLASTLMVIGLAMVFYFPHRRLWVICRPGQDNHTQVVIGSTARRDFGFDEEFRRVVSAVRERTKAGK